MPRYFSSPVTVNRLNFFSSSVFTAPPGVSLVYVTLCGGGGGGGGGMASAGDGPGGGGGGGAGFTFVNAPIYVRPTESISITIGSSGAGGKPLLNGTAGSASLFGTYISASGGGPGLAAVTDGDTGSFGGAGGSGGATGDASGGLGGIPGSAVAPPTCGTNGFASITQSFSGGTVLFGLLGGGGGSAGQSSVVSYRQLAYVSGGIPGTFTNTPFGIARSLHGGAGGGSALGRGSGSVDIGSGFGFGGAGGDGAVTGSNGGPGFCSISWL